MWACLSRLGLAVGDIGVWEAPGGGVEDQPIQAPARTEVDGRFWLRTVVMLSPYVPEDAAA